MGKPFINEIEKLNDTYRWAIQESVDELKSFVQNATANNLVTIGSGGSLTSAVFASTLHRSFGFSSRSTTPLDYRMSPRRVGGHESVLFLTAGGGNPDIRSALKESIVREPKQVGALCMRKGSKISKMVSNSNIASVFEYEPPAGKDGFLATNSLLASCVLLSRAFNVDDARAKELPKAFDKLCPKFDKVRHNEAIARDAWVVLHGRWSAPVAADIESKMSESAMASVQEADYRNFGHGRHHWVASRSKSTLVIALICPEDKDIAEKTLAQIPKSIPVIKLVSKHANQAATIDLLMQSFRLVELAGLVREVDPGRPKVASFGRKLYHLNVSVNNDLTGAEKVSTRAQSAIQRKTNWQSLSPSLKKQWLESYKEFVSKLNREKFSSFVFDYDETLCRSSERLTHPSKEITKALSSLLREGALVGIATGRGKSVRESLVKVIPKKYLGKVWIGYYNGGQIGILSDEAVPDLTHDLNVGLKSTLKVFNSHKMLCEIATLEARPTQIKIEPKRATDFQLTLKVVDSIVSRLFNANVKAVVSGRTVDVISGSTSKIRLCEHVASESADQGLGGSVLCFGDRGLWPGNDAEMLSQPFALSVNQVSGDPDTCWNLGGQGKRGVETTLEYLSYVYRSKTRSPHFRIKVPR